MRFSSTIENTSSRCKTRRCTGQNLSCPSLKPLHQFHHSSLRPGICIFSCVCGSLLSHRALNCASAAALTSPKVTAPIMHSSQNLCVSGYFHFWFRISPADDNTVRYYNSGSCWLLFSWRAEINACLGSDSGRIGSGAPWSPVGRKVVSRLKVLYLKWGFNLTDIILVGSQREALLSLKL